MDLENLRLSYYALSDEIRLKIIRLLMEFGELCVCQIQPVIKISQPNLSFHLRILRDSNLVKATKKGKWVFYSLNLENQLLKANYQFIKQIPIEKEELINLQNCKL